MPHRDRKERLAYQREWYAAHRDRVIHKVTQRKQTQYTGECVNCGATTVGNTPKKIPKFCGKPECRSMAGKLAAAKRGLNITNEGDKARSKEKSTD